MAVFGFFVQADEIDLAFVVEPGGLPLLAVPGFFAAMSFPAFLVAFTAFLPFFDFEITVLTVWPFFGKSLLVEVELQADFLAV